MLVLLLDVEINMVGFLPIQQRMWIVIITTCTCVLFVTILSHTLLSGSCSRIVSIVSATAFNHSDVNGDLSPGACLK